MLFKINLTTKSLSIFTVPKERHTNKNEIFKIHIFLKYLPIESESSIT